MRKAIEAIQALFEDEKVFLAYVFFGSNESLMLEKMKKTVNVKKIAKLLKERDLDQYDANNALNDVLYWKIVENKDLYHVACGLAAAIVLADVQDQCPVFFDKLPDFNNPVIDNVRFLCSPMKVSNE